MMNRIQTKKQWLYAIVGYGGIFWASVEAAAGQPFDALILIAVSVLVLHESYVEIKS